MLIATQNILYQNRQYVSGDILPNYDAKLVKAWLESGSAIDKTETKAAEAENAPAASVVTEAPEIEPEVKPKTATRKKK